MHRHAIPMPAQLPQLLSAIAWQQRAVQGVLPPMLQGAIGLRRLQAGHAKIS